MDEAAVMAVAQQLMGHLTGSAVTSGIDLGDRLGLYRVMAGAGPVSADDVAERAGCDHRLVREWLDGQAAAGLVGHDAVDDTYELDDATAVVLADEGSPIFMARGVRTLSSLGADLDRIATTFRGERSLEWGDHHDCLFDGVEWFFRPGYRAHLAAAWLPSLPGVVERLTAGADVLEVGCGHGAAAIALAQAYPATRVHGIDLHGPSIETARKRAAEAGVEDRCTFEVADACGYGGEHDLICFFDCLHDLGDPVGAASHARAHLTEDGSVLLVEPFALADRSSNIAENPIAALMYHASAMICTPTSLSQPVGAALGGQAGEARLAEVIEAAGFARLDRRAETPFNLILEARR